MADNYYGSSVADATLTSAGDMAKNATGGTETTKASTISGVSSFFEILSLGGTSASNGSIPAPTGKGWCFKFNSATTIPAGNYAAIFNYHSDHSASGVNFTIRFYKYSGGTYTSIGTIALNSQSVSTTKTQYTFSTASMGSTAFASGDYLYVDLWSTDGAATTTATIYESNSASSGVANDLQVTTPAVGTLATKSLGMRLRLAVQKTASTGLRLRLMVRNTRSLGLRLLLGYGHTVSLPVRLRLMVRTTRSLGVRLRLAAKSTRSLPLRLRLNSGIVSGGFCLYANGTGVASFDDFRVTQFPDPSLALEPVGRLGSSFVSWNAALPSTATTLAMYTSIRGDGTDWIDVTAQNGGPIPGLYAQPDPTIDGFGADSSANYTATNRTGGAAPTVAYDTAYSRLALSGGTNGLYLYSSLARADIDLLCVMDRADAGGLVWRFVDQSNYYVLVIADNLASVGTPNRATLYSVIGNVQTQLAQASITFVRGTFHSLRVSMLAGVITATLDGASLFSYTDPSPLGAGLVGLYNMSIWYDATYQYKKQLIVDHTKVSGGANLSNFPMLISFTNADLKSVANGGKVQNANGYDLIFTDSSQTTKLDHEIDYYNPATGQIVMWVRIPALSASTDTVIYCYFGNSAISTSQENKTGVWDSNYKRVYHLGDGTTLSLIDSTSNAQNGTNHGTTAATGQIVGGARLNGSNQYISFSDSGLASGNNPWTLDCWLYTSSASNYPVPLQYGATWLTSADNNKDCTFWIDPDTGGTINTGFAHAGNVQGPVLPLNTWHKLKGTFDGSTLTLYLDGVNVGSVSTTGGIVLSGGIIGVDQSFNFGWVAGVIDEVRISNIARSAGWDTTEYNNQSNPGTFYTVGATQANTTGTSRYYQLWIQPQGDSLLNTYVYTKEAEASTDATLTPQLLDMTVGAFNPNIGPGALIPGVDNRKKFGDKVLDDAAQQSGDYSWFIDQNLQFYFRKRTVAPAPWVLYSAPFGLVGGVDLEADNQLKVTVANDLYRNRQTLLNVINSGTFSDTFIGDSNRTSFTLRYPLAPGFIPTIKLNGNLQSVAQKGKTGAQWYYAPGDPVIAQDAGGTVMVGTDTLSVPLYTGTFLDTVTVDNVAAQAALKAVEVDGTGIVEAVEDVSGRNMTYAAGLVYAGQKLARYCINNARTMTFTTLRNGLAQGQILSVFVPEENLWDAQMLVTGYDQTLQTQPGDTILYTYLVTASELAPMASWSKLLAAGILLA